VQMYGNFPFKKLFRGKNIEKILAGIHQQFVVCFCSFKTDLPYYSKR